MSGLLSSIHTIADTAVQVIAVFVGFVGILQASRWGEKLKLTRANELLTLIQQWAEFAVRATEGANASAVKAGNRSLASEEKRAIAMSIIKAHVPDTVDEATMNDAIEAALHRVKGEECLVNLDPLLTAGASHGDTTGIQSTGE